MKLPFVIKDRQIQSNFDFIRSRVPAIIPTPQGSVAGIGGYSFSQVRSSVGLTMVVGVTVPTLDRTGFTTVYGYIVIAIRAYSHNSWTWYPRDTDIAFINSSTSQLFDITYIVVGK